MAETNPDPDDLVNDEIEIEESIVTIIEKLKTVTDTFYSKLPNLLELEEMKNKIIRLEDKLLKMDQKIDLLMTKDSAILTAKKMIESPKDLQKPENLFEFISEVNETAEINFVAFNNLKVASKDRVTLSVRLPEYTNLKLDRLVEDLKTLNKSPSLVSKQTIVTAIFEHFFLTFNLHDDVYTNKPD